MLSEQWEKVEKPEPVAFNRDQKVRALNRTVEYKSLVIYVYTVIELWSITVVHRYYDKSVQYLLETVVIVEPWITSQQLQSNFG